MSAKICKEYNKIVSVIKTSELKHLEYCRSMADTFLSRWADASKYNKLKSLIEERQRNLKTEEILKFKNS